MFFNLNDLFDENQHGFRAGHSCETALIEISNTCYKSLDAKKVIGLLFVDFKKAFDMVDAELLIYKLINYGFDNRSIKLVKNYFSNRKQMVNLDDVYSEDGPIELGVPQGSI